MRNICTILALLFLLGLIGCKDPYLPELEPGQSNFLVVEGIISPGDSATRIQLSRTSPINDSVPLRAERGASVVVEGEDNSLFPLVETRGGEYVAPKLQPDLSKKYRLKIQTANGGTYASDYVNLKQTPPVSLSWTRSPEGVQISLSSQDPQNNTRYYKWNYEETWEIRSPYDATYKYIDGEIRERDLAERQQMILCWGRTRPSSIRLVSTIPLASDIIDKEPVILIPENDEKLYVRYSILVRLQGLDKQGFEFFRLLKKNTESLGTLFDPQPFEITGNMHSLSNPKEKVIGYIMGSVMQEQRIFIKREELPQWSSKTGCISSIIPNKRDELMIFMGDDKIPYGIEGMMPITGYFAVDKRCADCRGRGNNVRPSFW